MGSTVYKVPKHINFLGYYFAIDKILREGNYDIVHIHKNSAIDILILKVLQRFPNIKVVVHSHNTFPSVGGKLEKLHKFNRKYLYDNADYRLACSDNAGKWMYGNGAFEIIKNGIDTKGFRFCTEYGEEIRAMYGIPMNAFVIGHVGRFTNQKNHSKLIDIFAAIEMHASHDSWVLLACLACGGNVFFDKKPHILFRRYNTNTSIDGGKLKSRLKYEFRYFEKYKNNRLDTACELLNCYNSNMSVSSKSFLEKVKNYKSSIRNLPTFYFMFAVIILECKENRLKGNFYKHLRSTSETMYFIHMYFVAFCALVLYKDDYNNFKSYLICAGGALAVSEIYSWMKNISNRSTTVSRLKHD